MEALVKPIEALLAPLFKSLPSLPDGVKKTIVKIWPWAALILGVLQLFALYSLWQLGNFTNQWANYANQIYAVTGQPGTYGLSVIYYVGLAVLAVDAILLLLAFAPLKSYKKSGWNLLIISTVINLAYGIIMLFDASYGGVGNLVSAIISSLIAFYFLFQVRDYYTGAKKV